MKQILLGIYPVPGTLPAYEILGEAEQRSRKKAQQQFFVIFTWYILSTESLISAIQGDIEEAKKRLDLPEHLKLKEDNFFQVPKSKVMNGHWRKSIFFIHSLFSNILLLITLQSHLGYVLKIKHFPTAVN